MNEVKNNSRKLIDKKITYIFAKCTEIHFGSNRKIILSKGGKNEKYSKTSKRCFRTDDDFACNNRVWL